MFIGRLAKLTGCTPKAIRLYEQMGLINEPERDGRYRTYNAHHLEIVHLIRRAQIAGFKLAEMSPLISAKNELKGEMNSLFGPAPTSVLHKAGSIACPDKQKLTSAPLRPVAD